MKINKWTLGLAAVGLVSLTPALRAAGPMPVPVTALSATTISGYVDTSAVWNPGTGNANPAPYAFNAGKQDGFNLDSVDVKFSKPLDEGKWSAGYTLELMYGPDAVSALSGLGSVIGGIGGSTPIREAFVDLRANVGNGLDFRVGAFDNILGYESTDDWKNPNWSRSYGYTIEPTEHVGVLMSYVFSPMVTAQVGVVNNITSPSPFGINSRNYDGAGGSAIESKKALISLITLTAPDSWGGWKGSSVSAGLDYGPGDGFNLAGTHLVDKTELYVGATLKTPVKGLSLGVAWDSINNSDLADEALVANIIPTVVTAIGGGGFALPKEGYASTLAAYVSYDLSDKASVNARAEYVHGSAFDSVVAPSKAQEAKIMAITGTFQYDLWGPNVISRIEARWDTSLDGSPMFGGMGPGIGGVEPVAPTKNNELTFAANLIYKF
jgi:hypothetical protein